MLIVWTKGTMKFFFSLIFILSSIACQAQYALPPIKMTASTLANFIPPDWFVSDSCFGDLNKDGLPDVVFILTKRDSVVVVNK